MRSSVPGRRWLFPAAVLLAVVVFVVALLVRDPSDGVLFLLVAPIGMVAVARGLWAGVGMAVVATAMLLVSDWLIHDFDLTALGYGGRIAPYFVMALLVSGLSEGMSRANAALADTVRDEQNFNTAVLETVGALVVVFDPDGRIVYFNRACERASGYAAQEAVGKLLVELLIPPEDVQRMSEMFVGLSPGDFPIVVENEWLTKDGGRRRIEWSSAALTDAQGTISYLIGTGLDVTERRAAERAVAESGERLAAFFDNAPAVLYWKDLDGRFVAVNKDYERLLLRSRKEIVGRDPGEFFPPDVVQSFRESDEQLLAGDEPVVYEETIPTPDGQRFYRTVKFALRGSDGKPYGVGGISADITDLVDARAEVETARRETVARLARAVEYRDEETGEHIERMSAYCELIARRLGWGEQRCQDIRMASAMHDAGKIAIPDGVLLKPGRLTDDERAIMETHAEVGWKLLRGSTSRVLELAATIAHTHHERFDGTGYPQRLAGSDIPLEGRITAVADVFDALTSDRVYRPAFPIERAVEMMNADRGTHFDPDLLDIFLDDLDTVLAIRAQPREHALAALPTTN